MYAAHSKNINRHKSFHPLTFSNLSKVEQRLAEGEAKETKQEERKAVLRRERDDDLLAELHEAAEGAPAATKGRRVDWLFGAEPDAAPAVRAAPASAHEAKEDKKATQEQQTGTVTAHETLAAKKELERLRKLKNDPLARVQAHRNAVVSETAKTLHRQEAAADFGNSSRLSEDVQGRLQKLLESRRGKSTS